MSTTSFSARAARPRRSCLGHVRGLRHPCRHGQGALPDRRGALHGVTGEVLDPAGLADRAAEVAARQRSAETRRTYAAMYRAFTAFLGPQATVEDLTPAAVRARRTKPVSNRWR